MKEPIPIFEKANTKSDSEKGHETRSSVRTLNCRIRIRIISILIVYVESSTFLLWLLLFPSPIFFVCYNERLYVYVCMRERERGRERERVCVSVEDRLLCLIVIISLYCFLYLLPFLLSFIFLLHSFYSLVCLLSLSMVLFTFFFICFCNLLSCAILTSPWVTLFLE